MFPNNMNPLLPSREKKSTKKPGAKCIGLQHGTEEVFHRKKPVPPKRPPPIPKVPQVADPPLDGLLPPIPEVPPRRLLKQNSRYKMTKSGGIAGLPTDQCIMIPHGHTDNIVRIVAHSVKKSHGHHLPKMIVSSKPVEKEEGDNCHAVCEVQKSKGEFCECVQPEADMITASIVYIIDGIEGGEYFVGTIHDNMGFRVFSLFTAMMDHKMEQNGDPQMHHFMIAPPPGASNGQRLLGGTSQHNVLWKRWRMSMKRTKRNRGFDRIFRGRKGEKAVESGRHARK